MNWLTKFFFRLTG